MKILGKKIKKDALWKVIVVVSSLLLILSSLAPLFIR